MLAESLEGVALFLLASITWPISRRWLEHWGSTPSERDATWPGDELLARNVPSRTRAVDVTAPATAVWPWLVQLGLGRGGFYSYELLEHLVGIPVTNVEQVMPELQEIARDDEVVLHPEQPPLHVSLVDPGRHLCFRTWRDEAEVEETRPAQLATWSLYLEPTGSERCRLVLRSSWERRRPRSPSERIQAAFEAPVDFVMEQRMLRTIRSLAERPA